MGEYPKAEPLLQEALRIRQKVLGPEHPDTALSLNNLGGLYRVMGQYDKAEPLFQEALRIRQKVLGPEHPDTATSLNNLAELYHDMGANLQALYDLLWAPIGQALPRQTKRVIISPDGQLNFISFATLLTKDKQFLAQTYDVQYVANGRDLLRELKPSTAKDVVLFANPDFGLASTPMLAKADNRSSDPDSKSIRGSEKREIE